MYQKKVASGPWLSVKWRHIILSPSPPKWLLLLALVVLLGGSKPIERSASRWRSATVPTRCPRLGTETGDSEFLSDGARKPRP